MNTYGTDPCQVSAPARYGIERAFETVAYVHINSTQPRRIPRRRHERKETHRPHDRVEGVIDLPPVARLAAPHPLFAAPRPPLNSPRQLLKIFLRNRGKTKNVSRPRTTKFWVSGHIVDVFLCPIISSYLIDRAMQDGREVRGKESRDGENRPPSSIAWSRQLRRLPRAASSREWAAVWCRHVLMKVGSVREQTGCGSADRGRRTAARQWPRPYHWTAAFFQGSAGLGEACV